MESWLVLVFSPYSNATNFIDKVDELSTTFVSITGLSGSITHPEAALTTGWLVLISASIGVWNIWNTADNVQNDITITFSAIYSHINCNEPIIGIDKRHLSNWITKIIIQISGSSSTRANNSDVFPVNCTYTIGEILLLIKTFCILL